MIINKITKKIFIVSSLCLLSFSNALSAQESTYGNVKDIVDFNVPSSEKSPYYDYPFQISTFRACNKNNIYNCLKFKWSECPVSSDNILSTSGPELIGLNFKLTGNAFFLGTPNKDEVFHEDIFEIRFNYRLEGESEWHTVSDTISANFYSFSYRHPFYNDISVYQGNGEHKEYLPLSNLQAVYLHGAVAESNIQFCNVKPGVIELHKAELIQYSN